MYYKAQNNEKILHYDITSLYPYSQRDFKFPVGSPTIITENFSTVDNYYGIIKCSVLPPTNLYFPVLPAKINNKLMFTLCKSCAVSFNNSLNCSHSLEERMLEGTWCSLEIQEAIKHGYKIIDIFEIYHWEESSDELFKGYINNFLKIKQESSGMFYIIHLLILQLFYNIFYKKVFPHGLIQNMININTSKII